MPVAHRRILPLRIPKLARRLIAVALTAGLTLTGAPAPAQQRLSFLEDAETEDTIRALSYPIWEVAGLNPDSVQIILINDPTLNAFVAAGQNIFINSGLLLKTEDPLQFLGVVAHETGHIAGGHLVRIRDAVEGASAQALLGLLLGLGAAIATGQAGAVVAGAGASELVQRSLLSFNRAQEQAADQAGLNFLDRAKLSAHGMLTFLEYLQSEDDRPINPQVEYLRTHPLTADRVEAVRFFVEKSQNSSKTISPALNERFQRVRAKLLAYLQPSVALQRYPETDRSITARYARAVALYRRNDFMRAIAGIDQLIMSEPENPFFHELRGQIFLETGRLPQAVPSYREAVRLKPDEPSLNRALALALLETQDASRTDEALRALQVTLKHDPRSPEAWRLTAVAWSRKGDNGQTAYATAESALSRGDVPAARYWADRAAQLLTKGSPSWLRAQDIRLAIQEAPPSQR